MNRKPSPAELEQFVHQQLHGLPPRRAPQSLEARVLAAIEQRAMIPWYHKSWGHWPAAVQAAFVGCATVVSGAAVAAFYLLSQGAEASALAAAAGERLSGVTTAYHVVAWTIDFAGRIFASIPSMWLYGGAAFLAAMYATFFGLGAAAYRAIYRNN